MDKLSPEEFHQWVSQPVTEWVMDRLRQRQQEMEQQAQQALYLNSSRADFLPSQLSAVFTRGQCDAIDAFTDAYQLEQWLEIAEGK